MSFNNPVAEEAVTDARTTPRTPIAIKGLILVKESPTESWKEQTTITSVSKNGAGFTLSRPCTVGRLVSLVSPMPVEFRSYDHAKELYPTMGVVQHCYAALEGEDTVYHVGIGFIGKQMPESYKQNPCENYRISGMDKNGMWMVTPATTEFQRRKEQRYWLNIPVTLSFTRKEDRATFRDETFTLNIAAGGASVATNIQAAVGDKIKFAYKDANFYAIAEVKGRRSKNGQPACLHLQFLETKFPVGKVVNAQMQPTDQRDAERALKGALCAATAAVR